MKIIIYLFGGVLIFFMLFMSFIMYRRDPSYIRKVYLTNYKDYFLGVIDVTWGFPFDFNSFEDWYS